MTYDFKKTEQLAQHLWEKSGTFEVANISRENKFYCLDMFPYPSGEGLHIGHIKGYTATDIITRFMKLTSHEVIHPMGWDAFGLPAENYAIKMGVNPKAITNKNIGNFKKQLQDLGFSYDWSREINTTDPSYYKWTQWIFLRLYEQGLAYEDEVPINFCPSCKTGLANEESVGGICERCASKVVKKKIRQWVLRITKYADRLLDDLETLDWPRPIIEMQKNWIGRSEGATVDFVIDDENINEAISVFTTRIDTIFSGTYLILAPEHHLVRKITTPESKEKVEQYIKMTVERSEIDRSTDDDNKTGVFTGAFAINPATGEKMPIWIADFVLLNYGTGAVFADAHDKRDFQLAKKYSIPLKVSIKPRDNKNWDRIEKLEECFEGEGILVNSGKFNTLSSAEARPKITEHLEKMGLARKSINYKLRDWVFSRQRYWGEPIPLVHCMKCGVVAVPETDLPVKLPDLEKYEPSGTGESPLVNAHDWVNTTCPRCKGPATRETNTMPQWAGSCWYYLRYLSPHFEDGVVDKNIENVAMPVDLYVGGAEHAVLHLLYARFWHKFLFDIDVVSTKEPFAKLRNVGLIMGPDGQKMSKSKGNIINPNIIADKYGSDALKMYTMFLGPFEQTASWNENGIKGVYKLLTGMYDNLSDRIAKADSKSQSLAKLEQNISAKIKNMQFNTIISDLMIFYNSGELSRLGDEEVKKFLIIISPIAPHLSEYFWSKFGTEGSIFNEKWPTLESNDIQDNFKIIVQVNGKKRAQIDTTDPRQEKVEAIAMDKINDYLSQNNLSVKKTIYIDGKLLNIVAN